MRFSDYNVWAGIVQIGIVMIIILFANAIRRKVPFIRNYLIPTPVIGGVLILILKQFNFFTQYIDNDFLQVITYHTLALAFISLALKIKPMNSEKKSVIIDSGAIMVSGYLIQGIFGLIITLILANTFFPGLFEAAGLLLPLGFGQGPGQAMNFGEIYEGKGFIGGIDFGLSIAGLGFFVACVVGVTFLNILKRKNKQAFSKINKDDSYVSHLEVSSPDEIPLTESVDKLTIQIAFVFLVYLVTYLFISAATALTAPLGEFAENSIHPLLWGFNFLFGVIFAVIIGKILVVLKKTNLMTRQYPNNFLLNRIGGFMFDIMIIASIGAIEVSMLNKLLLPLLLICSFGGFVTFVYIRRICKIVYPKYENEAFFSLYGTLTGTASTGMLLLREVDPKFETPAANNLVLLNFPAMLFGFPLLLLVPMAANSTSSALLVLGIIMVMFLLYNVIILRRYVFR